jgi:hypothetical protein
MIERKRLFKIMLQVVVAAMVAGASSALAHHSFSMFDMTKKVTLDATVTEFQWTNPHVYIEVDVPDGSAGTKHWSVELGSPSILQKGGWKHNTLKKGDKATLIVSPLKNGQAGGFLETITLSDGRVLGNGPGRGPQ